MTAIPRIGFCAALLAGALGFAALPASAQTYNYDNPGEESVIVTGPSFHLEGNPVRNVPEKISLSTRVRYDDLDLNSWDGRRALRWRVRDAAQDVCTRIDEAYPVYPQPGTNCYRTALRNGMLRADAAIRDAEEPPYDY